MPKTDTSKGKCRDCGAFQTLSGVRTAYIEAFDESHTAVRDAILDPTIDRSVQLIQAVAKIVGPGDEGET